MVSVYYPFSIGLTCDTCLCTVYMADGKVV